MRQIIKKLILGFSLFAMASCQTTKAPPGGSGAQKGAKGSAGKQGAKAKEEASSRDISLSLNQEVSVKSAQFKIKYARLIGDYRCRNSYCKKGQVRVLLEVTRGNKVTPVGLLYREKLVAGRFAQLGEHVILLKNVLFSSSADTPDILITVMPFAKAKEHGIYLNPEEAAKIEAEKAKKEKAKREAAKKNGGEDEAVKIPDASFDVEEPVDIDSE